MASSSEGRKVSGCFTTGYTIQAGWLGSLCVHLGLWTKHQIALLEWRSSLWLEFLGWRPASQSALPSVCQDYYSRKAPVGILVPLIWLCIISNKFNKTPLMSFYNLSLFSISNLQFLLFLVAPPSVAGHTPWFSITSHQLYMQYWTGFLWDRLNMELEYSFRTLKDTGRPTVASKIPIVRLHHWCHRLPEGLIYQLQSHYLTCCCIIFFWPPSCLTVGSFIHDHSHRKCWIPQVLIDVSDCPLIEVTSLPQILRYYSYCDLISLGFSYVFFYLTFGFCGYLSIQITF